MLAQMRHEHEHGLLENLKAGAGWVTPPPPPPPQHEGLLEKIGLGHESAPPPLAPKPAGILGHHHDADEPPTERLADKIGALGHGVVSHGRAPPPKEEHGLAHKLSGVFHPEEKKDEGGVSGLVRKISGALRGEEKKEEGVYLLDTMIYFHPSSSYVLVLPSRCSGQRYEAALGLDLYACLF
jgi:hypothetical protein